jgi:hypothetical protein
MLDHAAVSDLAKVNGDKGWLGGQLKLWLVDRPEKGAPEKGTRRVVERIGELQTRLAEICDPNGDGIEGKDRWGKTSFDLLSAVILHVMCKKRAEKLADRFSAGEGCDRVSAGRRRFGVVCMMQE